MAEIKIKNVLVPIDFTETSGKAVNEAIAIAKGLGAHLTLLNVEENPNSIPTSHEAQGMPETFQGIESSATLKINNLQDRIQQTDGVRATIKIANGDIHDEIIKYANEHAVDLIVMGTHGASGYKEMFIGSNAQRVVTLSDIPVLTLKHNVNGHGFKNILIPIDDSVHSREKMNLAMVLAQLYKSKIHIIGLPDSDDTETVNKFKVKLNSVEKLVQNEGLEYTTTIIHDDSLAKSAIEYAQKNNCDLIVINTGHESKITGIFLGAFAQQIVNHSEIPVLSIKHMEGHFEIETPGFGI